MFWSKLLIVCFGILMGLIAGYGWILYAKYCKAKRNKDPNAEKLYTSPEMVTLVSLLAIFELTVGIFF